MRMVEITQSGRDFWDDNRPPTKVGAEIRVRDAEDDKELCLFVLGLAYGAGPQDPNDLKNPQQWKRIISKLIDDKFLLSLEVDDEIR